MSNFPSWLKQEQGFTYKDPDGDTVVILGLGYFRFAGKRVQGLAAAYCMSGVWYTANLSDEDEFDKTYWAKSTPPRKLAAQVVN